MSDSASLHYISTLLYNFILCHWYRRQTKTQLHYTRALPVTVERDYTCLFITSVNKRQIANHNTDSLWNEGQQRGVSATPSRVITSFMCIRAAHPWHASYWLSETSTSLSHRRTARVYSDHCSLFWRYPVLTQSATLVRIQRCSCRLLEMHQVTTIVIFWKNIPPSFSLYLISQIHLVVFHCLKILLYYLKAPQ